MNTIRVFAVVFLACVALATLCRADSVDYTIIGPAGLSDCTFGDGP